MIRRLVNATICLMPFSYSIDAANRLVTSRGWGIVTGAEIMEHQDRLANDPAFRSEYSQLADLTAATAIEVDGDAVRALAKRDFFSATSRRALVVLMPHAVGLGRMYEAYHSLAGAREQFQVFSSCQEALLWLGKG